MKEPGDFSHVTGVLFDIDGTLVDTSYLHTVAWWEALRQSQIHVPMANIHRSIGMGSDRILNHLLGEDHDTTNDNKIVAAHSSLYSVYWERLSPLPGASELLHTCADRGLRVVLASSASATDLAALRRALDADTAITQVTSSADVDVSKPAPEILEVALERSGLRAGNVVFVGDSVWDVAAALKLDMPCIGLTCGGTSAAELLDAGAVETFDDPAQLLKSLDSSTIGTLMPG
ncbi:MAG TPA: HAD family hydrolase [Mycobacteriales bacterium]|nr:HAD family hydrolase [Mycobacteriales bacterium]